MALSNYDYEYSLPAAADYSANTVSYLGAVINSSGQIAVAGANAVIHGHIDGPGVKLGEQQRFVHNGKIIKAKIGGTVAAGDSLVTNASGQYVKGTTGQKTAAIALAAAVSGDIIEAFMMPGLAAAP